MKKRNALRQNKPNKLSGKKVRSNQDSSLNLKWRKHDEEISSEDEVSDEEHAESENESENGESSMETAEDKRRRLAKGYLEQIGSMIQHDEEGDYESDDELEINISDRLKRERLQKKGKYHREYGNLVESLEVNDLTHRYYYGHSGAITSIALTTDETTIITGSKDNAIFKWDTETGQRQELKRKWSHRTDDYQCHEGEILSVAVSSDGRYVVGGGKDNSIRVYDKRSRFAEVHIFKHHKGAITGLAFQTDSYALFSTSNDRCIKYWDLNEMGYIETLFGHQDTVHAIDCWHKLRPVSVSNDRSIRSWKVAESSHLVYRGHKGPIDAIKILTEDSFVSGSQDGKLCLWKDSKKTPTATIFESHGQDLGSPRWVSSLASIHASDLFASGSNDGFVRLWSVRNDSIKEVNAIPMNGFVNGLALSSRLLVAGCAREHRLGRWWSMKKCKDRLAVVRFPHDLAELVTVEIEGNEISETESDNSEEIEDSSVSDQH